MVYMGIDPGQNGGIAVINEDGEIFSLHPYSDDVLLENMDDYRPFQCRTVVEKVGAMPGQGVTSMFNFGQNFGFIQGVLRANRISFELVSPPKWKREFGVTKDKNTSIDVAKRLFPDVCLKATNRCKKDHDGMAEALLMAEFARRKL